MANAQREVLVSPSSSNGMEISTANTTGLDLDIYIVIAEWLGLEVPLVELSPCPWAINLESGKCIWINHYDGDRKIL